MHRPRDTYPLSHLRQHTGEHLDRLRAGQVETITHGGEAAMVVMSPEMYDQLLESLGRIDRWDEAISGIGEGRGRDAREVIHEVAEELGLEL